VAARLQPDEELRAVVLASLREGAKREGGGADRRKELTGQLERLRELYVVGDLTKDEYEMRRQAIDEEMERIGPPLDPQIERADAILRDFARFWEVEPKAAERRKLIASLFDRVWQDEGQIVAVKPREPFLRYFQLADEVAQLRTGDNGGSKGGGGQPRKARRKPHGNAAGVESGSDGTRTRDLRRDRPAL
jgi:chromatin segregation and condensation protein Rec8/ScpA/Scc1 (kleisin family)